MTRLRVKGYIGRRLRRHLSKIFHGLLENIAIEKRNHALIQRVRSRWQNVCVFKTFNAWASDVRETKRQRQLMQRFKQRSVHYDEVVETSVEYMYPGIVPRHAIAAAAANSDTAVPTVRSARALASSAPSSSAFRRSASRRMRAQKMRQLLLYRFMRQS